jgi:hypothetical protein
MKGVERLVEAALFKGGRDNLANGLVMDSAQQGIVQQLGLRLAAAPTTPSTPPEDRAPRLLHNQIISHFQYSPRGRLCSLEMATHTDALEAEWLHKLATMRDAIAKLNLPKSSLPEISLPNISDDELLFDSGSGNITDFLSDDSSDEEAPAPRAALPAPGGSSTISYNREWLDARIKAVVLRNPSHNPDDLANQIVAVLASDSTG